jgi:uncharacterized membrane protein
VKNAQDVQQIVQGVWDNYVRKTPQRVKLIDTFMAFLVVVGGLQFVYCVLAGNYVSLSLFWLLLHVLFVGIWVVAKRTAFRERFETDDVAIAV